jgi:hypothetical protein
VRGRRVVPPLLIDEKERHQHQGHTGTDERSDHGPVLPKQSSGQHGHADPFEVAVHQPDRGEQPEDEDRGSTMATKGTNSSGDLEAKPSATSELDREKR